MSITHVRWKAIASLGMLITLGIGIYLHRQRKKIKQTDKYGNLKLKAGGKDKKNTGGVDGGVLTTTGVLSNTLTEPNWENPYDMGYEKDVKAWVHPYKIYELGKKQGGSYAKELKAAYGGAWYLNDNEGAVQAVFEKIIDKVQVSNLSKAFWNCYQKDLWQYLSNFLTPNEMETYVQSPVKKLPNYRIIK